MTYDPSAYDIATIRELLTEAFTPEDLRRFREITMGKPIMWRQMTDLDTAGEVALFLRFSTYLLKHRKAPKPNGRPSIYHSKEGCDPKPPLSLRSPRRIWSKRLKPFPKPAGWLSKRSFKFTSPRPANRRPSCAR